MFKRILVPLDGSPLAERAIPHAELVARIFHSNIMLLQVLDPISYHENPNSVDPLSWQIRKAEADIYMSGIAKRLEESLCETPLQTEGPEKKARVEYSIREGKTAENIVNFAHTENIDLLVISTHGSGGLSRWNLSSITQKVISLIYIPVLLVRAYRLPETENAKIHYRSILVPMDGSRRAECALPAGIALAQGKLPLELPPEGGTQLPDLAAPTAAPPQTRLILAAVIKPPELPIPEPYPVEVVQLSEQMLNVNRLAASNYLGEMKERIPVECQTRTIENPSVSTAIQDLANQEEEVDLVLLCAHGSSGKLTWPYGSVARNYLEHGTKSVMVIQDVPRSQVQPSAAEIAAKKTGRR